MKGAFDFVIGGHDAAAIMGVNQYKTPLQVWGELTGTTEKEDISSKDVVIRGNELEPHALDLYAAVTGREVRMMSTHIEGVSERDDRPGQYAYTHPEYPWAKAALDALAYDPNDDGREPIDLDAKSVSHWIIDRWGERPESDTIQVPDPHHDDGIGYIQVPVPTATTIPLHYQVQLQFYMWVTGHLRASFAVPVVDDKLYRRPVVGSKTTLLPGVVDFRWCDMNRHQGFIEKLERAVVDFASCVALKERPSDGLTAADKEILPEILGAEVPGLEVELLPVASELVSTIHQAMNLSDKCKENIDTAKAELMDMLGTAAVGVLDDGRRVNFKTRKAYTRKPQPAIDVPASRILTVPRRKKETK